MAIKKPSKKAMLKKAEAKRKRALKLANKAGPKPKTSPVARVDQLAQIHSLSRNGLAQLENGVRTSLDQVWSNHIELKRGLDAAEFNLRAHQKLLNGIVADMIRLAQHVNAKAEEQFKFVDVPLVDVTADVGGKAEIVTRINWAVCHQAVEEDIKQLRAIEEAERVRLEELKAAEEIVKAREALIKEQQDAELGPVGSAIEKAVADRAAELTKAGNDPARVEAEAKKLVLATKRVAEEASKMARGEPYDEQVIAEAQRAIEEDQAKFPEGATIFGG